MEISPSLCMILSLVRMIGWNPLLQEEEEEEEELLTNEGFAAAAATTAACPNRLCPLVIWQCEDYMAGLVASDEDPSHVALLKSLFFYFLYSVDILLNSAPELMSP